MRCRCEDQDNYVHKEAHRSAPIIHRVSRQIFRRVDGQRSRAGHSPARPYEDDSEELLGSDDLEEFDLEH
jgi:hypothetical protein